MVTGAFTDLDYVYDVALLAEMLEIFLLALEAVSYTHLTLPTNREV